jgi:peptide/nickel transport system permease protein
VSIPEFWMAILLILVLSGCAGLLPPSGYVPLSEDPVGWASHMVMPA